jgi:hypothetical protein
VVAGLPAAVVAVVTLVYAAVIVDVLHRLTHLLLWQRVVVALLVVAPCGFVMGFCFPVGLRWTARLGQQQYLPWMWALNGAASVLAAFIAVLISMEFSIGASARTASVSYLVAALALASAGGPPRS